MKINIGNLLFLVGVPLVLSGACALAHTDVTAEQARELIDSTDGLIVIDVREPHQYSDTGGHIPGALNYPWYSEVLQARYEELPMHGPVLVVCGSGSRSHQAAKFLDLKGFSVVYDMQGGMSAWIWETETSVDSDGKYGGGTGEPNDPYQIATAEDLIDLGETPEDYDKHFILTDDIDLDPNLSGRKVFDKAVIAPDTDPNNPWYPFDGSDFTGVFDGNGREISHLAIIGKKYLGLFGRLGPGADVRNLGVVDVNVVGSRYCVGGLAGANLGDVTACYSTGAVSGFGAVGGLLGSNEGGAIVIDCRDGGAVNGTESIGGLVGQNSGCLSHCYSISAVRGSSDVGGLVGYNVADSVVSHSYSIGRVDGTSHVGGLVGNNTSYGLGTLDGVAIACFWDIQTSGQPSSAGGTGKTTAEMQTAGTFLDAGWDFVGETANGTEDIWSICEGTNYPRLVWQIPAGDFVCPDGITMDDFLFFMEHWLDDNCDSSNNYCEGTDLDQSGKVDVNDLEIFFESWSAE